MCGRLPPEADISLTISACSARKALDAKVRCPDDPRRSNAPPVAPAASAAGFSRPGRYLDGAGPRHRVADHPVAMRLIARTEVAEEDDALTNHRDDQGYDYGDNWAVSLHVAMLPDCPLS